MHDAYQLSTAYNADEAAHMRSTWNSYMASRVVFTHPLTSRTHGLAVSGLPAHPHPIATLSAWVNLVRTLRRGGLLFRGGYPKAGAGWSGVGSPTDMASIIPIKYLI
jgi:3',5'-cyclic AMP phosphodiesterase CpdA